MKCCFSKEDVLKPLQAVSAIADKKHTIPILNNILFEVKLGKLFLRSSDLETEISAEVLLSGKSIDGISTLPARKFLDIIKNIDAGSIININRGITTGNKVSLKTKNSTFILSSLDAKDFPVMDREFTASRFKISQSNFIKVIKKVQFAMGLNDVRYFLNGMLWEIESSVFRVVATDGHRMSLSEISIENTYLKKIQMIVPRKAILELQKIVFSKDNQVLDIQIGKSHFMLSSLNYAFASKLIDSKYPDYMKVVPTINDKLLIVNRIAFKQALLRASILSNEKHRGIRLQIKKNHLSILANNPDHEEAKDEIQAKYNSIPIEIGFNVTYLLDVINVLDTDAIKLYFYDTLMSLVVKDESMKGIYVIMPIRL